MKKELVTIASSLALLFGLNAVYAASTGDSKPKKCYALQVNYNIERETGIEIKKNDGCQGSITEDMKQKATRTYPVENEAIVTLRLLGPKGSVLLKFKMPAKNVTVNCNFIMSPLLGQNGHYECFSSNLNKNNIIDSAEKTNDPRLNR